MSPPNRTVDTPDGPARLIREWWPTDRLDPNRWFIVEYPDGTRKVVAGAALVAAAAGLVKP